MAQFNFEAIGTKWQIDIYDILDSESEDKILSRILDRIEIFDKTYSRFREDSTVTQISESSGKYSLPDDSLELFNIYYDLYKLTNGLFTPLVGNMLSDAGYDSKYSLVQNNPLQAAPDWEDVMEYKNNELFIYKPTILDFGAGGKGYLIDLVSEVLEDNGVVRYCIDAGGDILQRNLESIKIGLENPFDTNQIIGICELQNQSICGSAGTRRKWGDFTHIINPKTMRSPTDIVAVWVTAKTTLIADCIATCLFFVSPEILINLYDFEYVIVKDDKLVIKSTNFK
jgi:FAD:protein FMN transferase